MREDDYDVGCQWAVRDIRRWARTKSHGFRAKGIESMARHLDSLAECLYTPSPRGEVRIGRDAAFMGYVDTVHETIVAVRVQVQVAASPEEVVELKVLAR